MTMLSELEVLKVVCQRLDAAGIEYMLTGSYALAYYTTPRMTRDLDLVVALSEQDAKSITAMFSADFYVDIDDVRAAAQSRRMFNLMHLDSGIKLDFIVCKTSEYRQLEFGRRQRVDLAGVPLWIASREDLILSKLLWGRDSGSELQRRDARSLINDSMDRAYLLHWADRLGVENDLAEIMR
jgi:hypothetical protein